MATIFEINSEIEKLFDQMDECVDEETGEVIDEDKLEELHLQLDMLDLAKGEKIEGVAQWYKDCKIKAAALKAEEDNLRKRRKTYENKAESLKKYLTMLVNGNKFETPKVKITFRNTKSVQVEDEDKFIEWASINADDLLKYEITPQKTKIKEAIIDGRNIEYAEIVENKSIQIK